MILFTNLEDVKVDNVKYTAIPVLKLTSEKEFKKEKLTESQRKIFNLLQKEAKINNFQIRFK